MSFTEALKPGSHACWIFDNVDEQAFVMAKYFQEGLAAGMKCVCFLLDDETAARVQKLHPDFK